MFEKIRSIWGKSHATIGRNSNNNVILQNSTITNPIFCSNNADMIDALGDLKAYDTIQQQVQDMLSAAKKAHPLYPVFSATHNNQLNALVSTPETSDAFERYPKKIKGAFRIDYAKYPYMDKSETPWEYAYRTQTEIELETTAYQEYLGDIEDPFPVTKYSDGMTMVIGAPKFPPAVNATVSAGDVSISCQIRRKPWLKYGQMCFGTTSGECGFDLQLITFEDGSKTDIKLTKEYGMSLETQLLREKLIEAIRTTKQFTIDVGDSHLMTATISNDDLDADMFKTAKYLIAYYESLIKIEELLHCVFDTAHSEVSFDNYWAALILATSLSGRWHHIKADFDNEIRCDYDHISDDIASETFDMSQFTVEGKVISIDLQGVRFSADKYTIIYQGARINNLESVIKNKKRRRKKILLTFRPELGRSYFIKHCRFDGVKVIS